MGRGEKERERGEIKRIGQLTSSCLNIFRMCLKHPCMEGREHGLNSEYNGTKLCLLYLGNIPVLLEALSLEDWLWGIGKVFGERKQLSYCSHSIVRLK